MTNQGVKLTNTRAIEEITPNADWILVNKAVTDHIRDMNGAVLVHLPESAVQTTQWCEVIDVGPKCKYFTKEMCDHKHFVIVPELDNNMHVVRIDDENEFRFIRERVFLEPGPNRGFIYRSE